MSENNRFERVEAAIEAIRTGRMVVMVDDEDRENEGDLVIAAQHCTPDAINFMSKWGRGLICLSLTPARVEKLGLRMMVPTDPGHMGTAFTVSIEAREGVTTGISAADRAETVRVAASDEFDAGDIVSPGHIFPLRAQPGGVLVRSGHTEGSVDIAKLAGCPPAAVICEIMRDDGEMARMDDLEAFAREHQLPIVTIEDLIEYRLERESLVEEIGSEPFASDVLGISADDGWTLRAFRSRVEGTRRFVLLTKGPVATDEPVLLRAQRAQIVGDVFGANGSDSAMRIRHALKKIESAGRGAFLYVLGHGFGALGAPFSAERDEDAPGLRPRESGFRDFGLGAQVLKAVGINRITVLTDNPRKIVGLEGFGIEVMGSEPLEAGA